MGLEPIERGPRVEARQFSGAEIKHTPGEHLWVCVSMFRVRPAEQKHFLDTENLLTIEGPGCYWCEKKWEPGDENTVCTGGPEIQDPLAEVGRIRQAIVIDKQRYRRDHRAEPDTLILSTQAERTLRPKPDCPMIGGRLYGMFVEVDPNPDAPEVVVRRRGR